MRRLIAVVIALAAPAARAAPPPLPPVMELEDTPPPAPPPPFVHTPVAEAAADQPLAVAAEIDHAERWAEVQLRYRRRGEAGWSSAPFRRTAAGYLAVVPATATAPGVLEYWVAGRKRDGGAWEPLFLSPEAPHPVLIAGDRELRRRRALLALHDGHRSRLAVRSEYVDFGGRTLADGSAIRDQYWRIETDYTYRILAWVYSIRLGAGIIGGDTFQLAPDGSGGLVDAGRVGLRYGWAELRLRLGMLVRIDLRVILGVGPQHFDGGGGATLLIGTDPGTHFAIGIEGVSSIGLRGFLRLAWNTVPHVPMSFTIEATSFPSQDDISGRIYYGAGVRLGRHLYVEAQVGYATRDFRIGGPSLGAASTVEF
jgi:hypothetical protein